MPKINILSVNADTSEMTLIMAAVGAADLAVEKARKIGRKAPAVRAQVVDMPADVQSMLEKFITDIQALPDSVKKESAKARSKAAKQVEDLAARGEELVARIQHDPTTETLVHQAETAVAKSKGAVTTARRAAKDTSTAAKKTITTGRKEAAHVVDVVRDELENDVAKTVDTVKASIGRTRSSAKGTATTAKKAATRTRSSAKSAATSARKTGTAARKSAGRVAKKVGD